MNNNITLHKRTVAPSWGHEPCTPCTMRIVRRAMRAALAPMEWLRQYYASVLGHDVSMGLALRYVHAQAAFALAVFPSYGSFLGHAVAAAWFGVALALCRNGAGER